MKNVNIESFKGQTIKHIEQSEDEVIFTMKDDTKYKMYHSQDCCEYVYLEEVIGDLKDLLDTPLLEAEEVTNTSDEENCPPAIDGHDEYNSYTWTFYKLGTIKGHVTLRWFGSSNGYYSESVDIKQINGS